jgi:hypothetical protein
MAGRISMGARREITMAVAERYRVAGRAEKGRILDELCAVTGWHRKHAVRALAGQPAIELDEPRRREPTNGAIIKDALVALWEASDRICGKWLKVMFPTLLSALERHPRLKLGKADRSPVLGVSAATIDRLLIDTKITAAGDKRRRAGFYSAVRREVPIRTFNDWNDPAPGDMVAHGGKVGGRLVHPDADDGRCGDRLDRMLAAADARERACRPGDGTCTEPVPVAGAGRGLRQ